MVQRDIADEVRAALTELAGRAAKDPRAARAGVTRLAKSVAADLLPRFYEESSRAFVATGLPDVAVAFFGKARKADPRITAGSELDRLHEVFLEFAPADAVAPADLHRYVKAMSIQLAPADVYARFRELTDAMLAAGVAPYPKMFTDLRRMAAAGGIDRAAAEREVAERLLRSGALAAAPPLIWSTAGPALAAAAAGDPDLLDALIAAEPAAGPADANPVHLWLGLLADAGAGSVLPARWFSGSGARCPADVLHRLVEQAGPRLFPGPLRPVPPERSPGAAVSDAAPQSGPTHPRPWCPAEPAAWQLRTDADDRHPDWGATTDFEALAAKLSRPSSWLAAKTTRFVRDLGLRSKVDYHDRLRRVWTAPPPFPGTVRELVSGWRAQAESGSLPLLEAALAHLAPLSEAGFADLDEGFLRGWHITDPVDALVDTLRTGIPEELALPPFDGLLAAVGDHSTGQVVQHGDILSVCGHYMASMMVFTPDAPPERIPAPSRPQPDLSSGPLPSDTSLAWYDGSCVRLSAFHHATGWRTYRVDGGTAEYDMLLTLDLEGDSRSAGPQYPATGEVRFPGASSATAVSCADGRLRFHAPDGGQTAQLPFGAVQQITRGTRFVPPPGWWRHMTPVDGEGSRALRRIDRPAAAQLARAAHLGPRATLRCLESLLPRITSPALREGVAAQAALAARCQTQIARLGADGPPPPPLLATRADMPVRRSAAFMAAGRALAFAIQEAAPVPEPGDPRPVPSKEPVGLIDIPEIPYRSFDLFSRIGERALKVVWPWAGDLERRVELEQLRVWTGTPFADGSGRWRLLWMVAPRTARPVFPAGGGTLAHLLRGAGDHRVQRPRQARVGDRVRARRAVRPGGPGGVEPDRERAAAGLGHR